MKRSARCLMLSLVTFFLIASVSAFGQDWDRDHDRGRFPRDGVCFYRGPHFTGDYFCARPGDSMDRLGEGFNDHIRSVQVFGRAAVIVFNDSDYRGASTRFGRDMDDLRFWGLVDHPRKNWADRISSVEVVYAGDRDDRDDGGYYRRGHDRDREHYRDDDNLLYFHLNLGGHD